MRKGIVRVLAALMLLALCPACLAEVEDVASECRFLVSEGSAKQIQDASLDTAWTPRGENPELRVMLPEGGAAYLQIDWLLPPAEYTITEYDANQAEIAAHSAADDSFACISQLYALNENSRYVFLRFSQQGQGISKLRVFPRGELPATAVAWEPPHEKCDLLVVSTHEDDEWLWFGAIIPYYDLVRGKDVQVVYMADCGRYRYAEALNSLAVAGVRTYPHFEGLPDKRDNSLAAAVRTWTSKDHIIEVMAGIIRRYRPEVILTHDWDGEYGHPQHILTSRCMEYAIEAAADPGKYPESAEKYGAWQVKKLYRHLEEKGRIEFDWHAAYDEFGGRTGIQVATDSMAQHASQLKFFQVEDHGEYDNALFGLSWSAVGDDAVHADLFENIPEPTPVPTPTPEATPSPEPTLEPTPEPSAAPTAEPLPEFTPETAPPEVDMEEARGGSALPAVAGIAALSVCGGIGYALYARQRTLRRRKRRRKGKKGSAKKRAAKPGAANGSKTQRKSKGKDRA